MVTGLNPQTNRIAIQLKAFPNSTKGYCLEIFSLQDLHLPPWISQLKSGISSYHLSTCPHFMQCDLLIAMFCPRGILYIQTFKKLPINNPSIKIIVITYTNKNGPNHKKSDIDALLPSHNIPVKVIIPKGTV